MRKTLNFFFNKKDARKLLRRWRDENMRMSKDILELWESTVASSINKFGDESINIKFKIKKSCIYL